MPTRFAIRFPVALVLFAAILFSCQKESKKVSEISLERWTVTGDSSQYEKGAINYLEKVQFNEEGLESAKLFYNTNKQLEAQEVRIFDKNTGFPTGSQYKSTADSLLSYYTFTTDSYGQVIESKAYNASNDELLRIEKFQYNARKHLVKKMVFDADNNPVRIFNYTLDKLGNEQQVQVLTGEEKLILTEIFRITKYDGQKKWIEKWGFVDDQPFSFLARDVKYQ